MACNSSNCQSNCYKNDDEQEEDMPPPTDRNSGNTNSNGQQNLCIKCKAKPPISSASAAGGGDDARFCAECFRNILYGKFRLAVTSHSMITPSDNVLVAFSGGPASRVALQFVHEMQHRAQKNYDAIKERSLPVFGVEVAFIDESAVYPVASEKVDDAIREMKLVVSKLASPTKQLHVFPIENIYASDSIDGKDRLMKLLSVVNDATGKEDVPAASASGGLAKVCF